MTNYSTKHRPALMFVCTVTNLYIHSQHTLYLFCYHLIFVSFFPLFVLLIHKKNSLVICIGDTKRDKILMSFNKAVFFSVKWKSQKSIKTLTIFNVLQISLLEKQCFKIHYIELIDYFQELNFVSGDDVCFYFRFFKVIA